MNKTNMNSSSDLITPHGLQIVIDNGVELSDNNSIWTRNPRWSDYYDKTSSWRINLGAFFTEWIEY